jgi:uncharacterized protein YcaQ
VKSIAATLPEARRIAVRAQGLAGGETDVLSMVRRLGFLQMDPIATVAPPQHLVLFDRLGRFETAELDRLLWRERKLVEWDAFIWPVEDLPLLRARQRRTRTNPMAPVRGFLESQRSLRRYLLRELERSGPVPSRDLNADHLPKSVPHPWWGARPVRMMLEVLAARGEIAVAGRSGRQRVWDLAERVYPPGETLPWRDAERLITEKKRRSLGVWLERGQLRTHAGLPDEPVPDRVVFLSPFDRLIHDRARAEALFGFYYRLEMYVPRVKRQYGYYVLPILHGDRIAGRIDVVRADVPGGLQVNGVWWEEGVAPVDLEPALAELASFVRSDVSVDPRA